MRQGQRRRLLHLIIVPSMASWTIYSSLSLSMSTSAQSNPLFDQPVIMSPRATLLELPSLDELTRNPAGLMTCIDPLLPIQDRIVRNVNDTKTPTTRRIPRVIHVSFKSRCLPPEMYDAMEVWKTALPYHSFYFHDDQAVDRLFALSFPEFPQLKSLMRCVLFRGAMKIDVWRMYLYGGIYSDMDQYPIQETFGEVSPIGQDDYAFFLSDSWNRPSQWFFAAVKRHPILYFTMQEIFLRLHKLEDVERPNVVFVTGPDAVKFGYGISMGWKTDLGKDIYQEGTHKCLPKFGDYTVTKKRNTEHYMKQLDMKEMVQWNETHRITRKQRIEWQSGVQHWMDEKNSRMRKFGGTCLELLYSLDAMT